MVNMMKGLKAKIEVLENKKEPNDVDDIGDIIEKQKIVEEKLGVNSKQIMKLDKEMEELNEQIKDSKENVVRETSKGFDANQVEAKKCRYYNNGTVNIKQNLDISMQQAFAKDTWKIRSAT